MDMPDFIEGLKQSLKTQPKTEVVFTKKTTGEDRTMVCTMHPPTITETYDKNNLPVSTSTKTIKYDPEKTARVFDVEIEEWRSFNYDSVKTWKTL